MLARLIRIILGFALACLVAGLIKTAFVITPADLIAEAEHRRMDLLGISGLLILATATQSAVFAAPFALLAAIFAQWFKLRSSAFYILAGVVISILGFAVQLATENSGQPTIANTYAVLAYVVSGAVAGWVYWIFAGYGRGRGRRKDFVIPRDSGPTTRQA